MPPSNPVEELAHKRSRLWYRLLRPPLPLYHNPEELRRQPPLGRWNLYIGGGGHEVDGYINVDLFPLLGVNVLCNAEALPFRSDLFQRIECDAVLEHTINPWQVIAEIHRCLTPGGSVHIVVPFCHPFHEYPRDYYRFSPDGLRELVRPLEVTSSGWAHGADGHSARFFFGIRQALVLQPADETAGIWGMWLAAIPTAISGSASTAERRSHADRKPLLCVGEKRVGQEGWEDSSRSTIKGVATHQNRRIARVLGPELRRAPVPERASKTRRPFHGGGPALPKPQGASEATAPWARGRHVPFFL